MPIDGDVILKAALDTTNVEKSIEGLKGTVKKAFTTFLKYGLGVRSFFFLFRKLRKQLIDGMGNLAQVSQPFNAAMTSMQNALANLKSSFASAFAPIIQAVAPAITTFINLIANAVDAVGKLIAALTGQTTYIKYIATQQDYAQSVNNTADSANKASKATDKANKSAKKYQRTLAGFDDVNILKDPNKDSDSDSGGSGGTGGSGGKLSPIAGVIDTPLSEAFKDLSDKLKEAWEKADFTEIGTIVGTKLKDALDNIPWNDIKTTLKKIAGSIATFLNGFLKVPGLFTTIGKTIAEAINSAFEFVNKFVQNFHWTSFGIAIRDLIVGALDNLDWPLIEETASKLGVGLGNMINAALSDPKIWSLAFTTLARAINALFTLVKNFMLTVEWESIGKSVAEGIRDGVGKIDWLSWGVTIALFVNSIFRLLKGFFENFPWKDLGNGIVEAIKGFFLEFNWKDAGAALYTFLHGLLTTFRTVLQRMPWKSVPFYITDAIKKFLEGFDWQDLIDNTIGLIQDALDALIDLISGSSKKGEKSPIVTALESLKESVGKIDAKLFENLGKAIGKLVDALSPVAEGFGAGFIAFFSKLIDFGVTVLDALGVAIGDIADALGKMDPDVLEKVGVALGIVAGAFITLNTVSGFISGFAGIISGIGAASAGAAGTISGVGTAIAGITLPALGATLGLSGFFAILKTETVGESKEELDELNSTMGNVDRAVGHLGLKYGWTKEQMDAITEPMRNISETDGPAMEEAFKEIGTNIENAGGSTDDFNEALNDVASHGVTGTAFTNISNYLGGISKSAKDADKDTVGLSDAFGLFSAPGFSAILKLALLKGTVDALGSSGKLTEEDTAKLQKTLDDYDANPTEKNMGKIQKAMEDAGVSAGDLNMAYITAVKTLPNELKPEYAKLASSLAINNKKTQSTMKKGGENIVQGAIDGIEAKESDLSDTMDDVVKDDILGTFDEGMDMHSPSKKMESRGQNLIDGLKNGISSRKPIVDALIRTLVANLNKIIIGFANAFNSSGTTLMKNLYNGINGQRKSLTSLISSISSSMLSKVNPGSWTTIGYNAAVGMYNGFVSLNGRLQQMVYNVASNMLSAAERALDIGSPSKKFAWIGEMTMLGLTGGIVDNENQPISAVEDVTAELEKATENVDLGITFDTKLSELLNTFDLILTDFSDIIIERFDNLIGSLAVLGTPAFANIPSIAQGKIVPTSLNSATTNNSEIANLRKAIDTLNTDKLTRQDITDIVTTAIRNLPINLYIGDEQIATHANRGNAIISRRFG